MQGIPVHEQLKYTAKYMPSVQKHFPPKLFHSLKGTSFKYIPVAIGAFNEKLEDMKNMNFNGKTPIEMYEEHIYDKLASKYSN